MQQRLVCVEAGQTFSIQRVEVLTRRSAAFTAASHAAALGGDVSHGVANRPEAQLGDARVDVGRAQCCHHGGQQLVVVDRGPFHRWWSTAPHRYFDGSGGDTA